VTPQILGGVGIAAFAVLVVWARSWLFDGWATRTVGRIVLCLCLLALTFVMAMASAEPPARKDGVRVAVASAHAASAPGAASEPTRKAPTLDETKARYTALGIGIGAVAALIAHECGQDQASPWQPGDGKPPWAPGPPPAVPPVPARGRR